MSEDRRTIKIALISCEPGDPKRLIDVVRSLAEQHPDSDIDFHYEGKSSSSTRSDSTASEPDQSDRDKHLENRLTSAADQVLADQTKDHPKKDGKNVRSAKSGEERLTARRRFLQILAGGAAGTLGVFGIRLRKEILDSIFDDKPDVLQEHKPETDPADSSAG